MNTVGQYMAKIPGVSNLVSAYQNASDADKANWRAIGGMVNLAGITPANIGRKAVLSDIEKSAAEKAASGAFASTPQEIVNESARNIGPLTKGQAAATIAGNATPSNIWSRIENAISSLPGGAGVMAKFKGKQSEAAVTALNKIAGGDLGNISDNVAKKISDAVELSHSQDKAAFRSAYNDAISAGKVALIDGEVAANKIDKKLVNSSAYQNLAPSDKSMIDSFLERLRGIRDKSIIENVPAKESPVIEEGYRAGMSKKVLGQEPQGAGKIASNYDAYRYLQTDVGGAMAQLQKQIWSGAANPSQAQRAISVLGEIKTTMKANEYAHLRIIGGNDLVNSLKQIDALYSQEKGPLTAIQKMFGINKDVGEQGYVSAEQALNKFIDPKNADRFNMVLSHLPEDTHENIKQAILNNVLKKSINMRTVEGVGTIPVSIKVETFRRNFQKYAGLIDKVSKPEDKKYLNDFMNYLDRSQIKNISFDNAANKSGTGFMNAIAGMLGVEGLGGMLSMSHLPHTAAIGAATMATVPTTMSLSALLAKSATKQPKNLAIRSLLKP
jgi:hypothetical protein